MLVFAMETLVVSQHRNQYYGSSKPHGPARFGSSPSRNFRGINCRSFQSGTGILPTPLTSFISPETNRPCSPKSPSTHGKSQSRNKICTKSNPKSSPIAINTKKGKFFSEIVPDENILFSELWAGPTYSNSPSPSSLPIPKFSVRPNRTMSLPGSSPEIEMYPVAKSAPASPSREHFSSRRDIFLTADSATKTLRRILNLSIDDE